MAKCIPMIYCSEMEGEEGLCGLFGVEEEHESNEAEEFTVKYDHYDRQSMRFAPQLSSLRLALVKKHHSLWGEYIYNAARVVADYIENNKIDVKGKNVLELGAGAGLPGLAAALNRAAGVVLTDYGSLTDRSLVAAIDINIDYIKEYCDSSTVIKGLPYIWGKSVNDLLLAQDAKFDIIIMADCIFNRSEHRKLLMTCAMALRKTGIAYCSFSHHDPHKKELDLNFFKLAKEEFNFECTYKGQEQRKAYPFQEGDAGTLLARGIVYIYALTFIS